MLRRLFMITAGVVAALVAGMLPAAAVGSFGPATVDVAGCAGVYGNAAISSTGTVRGFAVCSSSKYSPIVFFEQTASGIHRSWSTPFSGNVLAVAWDGVDATYIMYQQNNNLLIGKRTEHNGSYLPSTTLAIRSTAGVYDAGLVASNNQWWAVWSEQVGTGSSSHSQLFQRHTLLGTQGRTRITTTAQNVNDLQPALTYYAKRVTMAWTRLTSTKTSATSAIRIGRNYGLGWQSGPLTGVGPDNFVPRIVEYAGVDYVTWIRNNGEIWYADNATGPFRSHRFATTGIKPSVAVSGSNVFVSWTAVDPDPRTVVAQRTGGAWTTASIAPAQSTSLGVLAQGTKARVVYATSSSVLLRAQP